MALGLVLVLGVFREAWPWHFFPRVDHTQPLLAPPPRLGLIPPALDKAAAAPDRLHLPLPDITTASVSAEPHVPRTLAASGSPSLAVAFAQARLALRPPDADETVNPAYQGVHYLGSNPGQGLSARFRAGSVQFGKEGDSTWQATFRYHSSEASAIGNTAAALPQAGGNGIEFEHGAGVTEWYLNRAEGWEHGFHLARRPQTLAGGPEVCLHVEVAGLTARADATPGREGALELVHPASGQPVLRYDGLKVWDATGKSIPARLEAPGGTIAILIADAGAAYPLTVDPLITSTEQKVVSPKASGTGGYSNFFGHAVALSGNTAVIGAYLDSSPGKIQDGAAYVFVREASGWNFQQRITALDGADRDYFGITVALSGNTALIGMQSEGGNYFARVFVREGTTWTLQAKLEAAEAASFGYFGYAVAVDGDTAAVTAVGENTPAGDNSGAAYVFVRTGTTWTRQARLVPDSPAPRQGFGNCVAIHGDTVLIGHRDDETAAGQSAGSAYVFVRSGTTWTQQAKLLAPDAYQSDLFGEGVAISGDTVLVGAPGADVLPNISSAGKACVFVRNGTVWSLQAELFAATRAELDFFGYSVALDGDTAAVGAPIKDTEEAANGFPKGERGVVRVFSRSGGVWRPQLTIEAPDGEKDDQFGVSLAMSGNTLLVGADYDDYANNLNAGSAWFYDLTTLPPGESLRSIEMLLGTVVIRGLATPGSTYLMQRSLTGVGGWQQVGEDLVIPEDGHFLFRDPAPPEGRAFYRLARR